MRHLKKCLILMMLLMSGTMQAFAAGPQNAWSETDQVYYLKTSDRMEDEFVVNGSITFQAVATGNTIPSYRDCGVTFAPASEGEVIQITVNSIDLAGDNYLLLYEGDVDVSNLGTSSASDGVDQSRYMPAGWVKKYQSGSAGETYVATAANGKLSFGFHSTSPNGQTGFSITVTSMSLKDMEFGSVSAISGLNPVNRGAKNQAIFGVDVLMDGGGNPMTLNQLKIDAGALTGTTQLTNVRLYKGETYTADNLLATAATAGDDLSAADVVLKNGHNKFMVVADIDANASGTIPSLTVTSAKIAGEERAISAATADAVVINNVILMPAEAATYVIGEDAEFYDDGGKDGKISLNFTGALTFVPATEGNAIKVDFSKLDLFNTSTIGKNDVLKVYNGTTADEANLILDLTGTTETSKMVKSTSPDGAMTITLVSTTGVAKDGWEATVSQFLPGDMTFKTLTAQTVEGNETVSAGDRNVQMILVDAETDNQSNPLALTALKVGTTAAERIESVKAYYLGDKTTFTTANLYGSAQPVNGDMTVSGNQTLAEGHNYFALVIDLNNEGVNGQTVDLSFNGATIAEIEQTATATKTRTINNVCRATQGSHSHVIKGDWTFTNTEGYSGKYETVITDYIVTFTPAEAGTVAQIDFSKFDVYYASSSYGTKATFEIYSGTEVNNANLLWQLNDASLASTGPGKVLRSQAADGSLTIRFNPQTTSSYYAGTGWTATVSPFQNHDMEVKSVTVNQTSTDELATGAVDAELIDFNVVTEGTLTTKVLNSIKLDLKNCQEAIAKVNVYYNNVNDRSTAVAFGSVENPAATEVNVAGERELAEASNYFWVTVDLKADAAAETAVDAKLISLTDAAGVVTAVENGDPEGERVVKNIFLLQPGENVVVVNEPLMFYDDGGPNGKVSKGLKGNVTFVPGRDNCAIELTTKGTFSIGSGRMYVYSGSEANQDNVLGSVTGYGSTNGPSNLVSKAEDGKMYVTYEGNTTATTLDGWAIEVKLHEKTPFVIESVAAEPTTADVMRNSTDNVMQQLKMTVSGDKNPIAIGSVKFNTTGTTAVSDITNAKLYCTGHKTMFSTENLLASTTVVAGENVLTLTEPLTITENGDYYLWLTYDIAQEATAGNTVVAQAISLNAGEDMTITGDAANRTIKAGLKGNYIIGASEAANYPNFAAATAALQGGIEGAVTFQVEGGTYAENIWFASVPGVSEQNTITFTSLNGNRDEVIVTGSGSSEYMPGSSSYKKGMVFVENTPYVTIEKMTFAPAKESEYNYVIQTYDRSRHFTLRECHVSATPVTSGYSGINLVKTSAGSEDNCNNDYGTFENNVLDGGYIALALGGTNYVALTREKGLVVRGNTISEAGSKGIYVYDEDDMIVENNTINQSTTQRTGYWGIDVARVRGNAVIAGNKITNSTNYYNGGIELRMESHGTANQPILVYNNVVNITNSPSNSSAGIEIDGDNSYISLYNNTVRIAGNGGYAYYTATRNPASYEGILLQNNLFQNLTSATAAMFIHANFMGKAQFVNNALYGATVLADTDIDALNAMEGCSGNIVKQAEFLSETDLHLTSAEGLQIGLPVDFVTTDADGVERPAENPTVGAYEFAQIVVVAPEIAEGYPVVTNVKQTTATVKTKWNVSGQLFSMIEKQESAAPAPQRAAQKAPAKAPTADDLLATTPVDVAADTEVSTQFKNLEANTDYKAYFLLVSALDEAQSEVVETEVFKTAPATLAIDLAHPFDAIETGASTTLEAEVTGGLEPYTYEWRDQMNNVLGTDATVTVTPEYTYGYKLTVTSADGQTAVAKTGVYVLGAPVTATFEDNYLPEESYFSGDNDDDVFYSGSYAFHVADYGGWWFGFGMSNQTSTAFNGLDDQFHGAVGSGNNGSATYCVAYPSGTSIDVTNNLDGEQLTGMYITNSAYAYSSMLNGDAIAKKFEQGDWFKLTITGYNESKAVTGTVEAYLADLRSENTADHYILNEWKWVDLSPLGVVSSVKFVLSSSDVGQWGMNTPGYVCVDDFNSPNPGTSTGVNNVNAGKQVATVKYVNIAGVMSDKPFDGVNIVVTTYTDGSQSTMKVLK